MYYLVKTTKKDFKDFKLKGRFNNVSEFYEFIDNNDMFERDDFIDTITKSLELYGGLIQLKNGFKLVNTSYKSEYKADYRLENLKHLIRDNTIDTIINE